MLHQIKGEFHGFKRSYSLCKIVAVDCISKDDSTFFIDYYADKGVIGYEIASIKYFLLFLAPFQDWKAASLGALDNSEDIHLRFSLTGKPIILNHSKEGYDLCSAASGGLIPKNFEASMFLFEMPSSAPSGKGNVAGYMIELPENIHFKHVLITNIYYHLYNAMFETVRNLLWRIAIKHVNGKMQIYWIVRWEKVKGYSYGIDGKFISAMMNKFLAGCGSIDNEIIEGPINGNTLKFDNKVQKIKYSFKKNTYNIIEIPVIINFPLRESSDSPTESGEQKSSPKVMSKPILGDQVENSAEQKIYEEKASSVDVSMEVATTVEDSKSFSDKESTDKTVSSPTGSVSSLVRSSGANGFMLKSKTLTDDSTDIMEIKFRLDLRSDSLEDAITLRISIVENVMKEFPELISIQLGSISSSQGFLRIRSPSGSLSEMAQMKATLAKVSHQITNIRLFYRRTK